ncbi:MAG: HNH endonuclease [Actinomycetota bacterium]|nr:HNH endonuclease [Actinomycetota bacterium]
MIKVVERRRRGADDLARFEPEIEALLASFSEFLPEWKECPAVFRVARVETEGGTVPFLDNVVLPDVKHNLDLVLEMLNYIREQRGLPSIAMPLFVQPDEIALALRQPRTAATERPGALPTGAERAAGHPRGFRSRRKREKTRRLVLERDGWRCTRCGAANDLHLHIAGGGRRADDPEAYVTLCRRCHLEADGQAPLAAPASFHLRYRDEVGPVPIRSQLALVFQRSSITWVGFVFGRDYVLLPN